MFDFKYAKPGDITEACRLLNELDNAEIIAGGQSLIPMLRLRAASPDFLIDLNDLQDQEYIKLEENQIRIGCLTRHADIAESSIVKNHCPVLANTAERIGDVQVRNRGTLCGSIAHADPSGDPPVITSLLDGEIVAQNSSGVKHYQGSSFYQGFYETKLEKNMILTEVRFPALHQSEGAGFAKYEPSEGSYPVATVGAYIRRENNHAASVKVVSGAIEEGPTIIPEVSDYLNDKLLTDEHIQEAAVIAGNQSNPIDDAEGSAEFKSEITKHLAKKALNTANLNTKQKYD